MSLGHTRLLGAVLCVLLLTVGSLGTAFAGDGKSCGGKKDKETSAAVAFEARPIA